MEDPSFNHSRLGHQRFNIKCFRIIKNKFDLLIFPNQIKVEFNLNNLLAFIEALIKVRYINKMSTITDGAFSSLFDSC